MNAALFVLAWTLAGQLAPGASGNGSAAALTPGNLPAGYVRPHPAVARVIVAERDGFSYGSGVLVDVRAQRALLVTNWHVVRDATGDITLLFPDGFTSGARVVKTDNRWDLAALVLWPPPAQAVSIAVDAPRPGEPLVIAGYGHGVYRESSGVCSQYLAPDERSPREILELDTAARNGDSGGPIFNSRGELAGVLFGSSPNSTAGSYCGRVRTFLDALMPADAPQIAQTDPWAQAIAGPPPEGPASVTVLTPLAPLTSPPTDPWLSAAASAWSEPTVPQSTTPAPSVEPKPASPPPATVSANTSPTWEIGDSARAAAEAPAAAVPIAPAESSGKASWNFGPSGGRGKQHVKSMTPQSPVSEPGPSQTPGSPTSLAPPLKLGPQSSALPDSSVVASSGQWSRIPETTASITERDVSEVPGSNADSNLQTSNADPSEPVSTFEQWIGGDSWTMVKTATAALLGLLLLSHVIYYLRHQRARRAAE